MHLNGHHIIQFAMKRWKLTKKDIAKDYLDCSQSYLSRRDKPPIIDSNLYYNKLFNVTHKGSAAYGENEVVLLEHLKNYLVKEGCTQEAILIAKLQKDGKRYQYFDILDEIFSWANTQSSKSNSSKKTVSEPLEQVAEKSTNDIPNVNVSFVPTTDNSKDEIVSQRDNIGAQLSIPREYKKCVYCAKWDGNVSHAGKIKAGVYGVCMMYNNKQLSTNGVDCIDYEPNESRIINHKLSNRAF